MLVLNKVRNILKLTGPVFKNSLLCTFKVPLNQVSGKK